ncbi:hypothetical protein EVAR_81131_1 [Eumeta japonica]|uniref:U11/U12 small nuclear ribonucleoprotein 35 kDa protein n=1 Tax=Eumeta variegata TaxID=151549 RepID=A0A4C1YW41_EUMVA|nr:hypothetical protein EVAR_81131_1 [Eumeta japonica]
MTHDSKIWSKYAEEYDPVKIGSIDGTDTVPHDRAIIRALNSEYTPNKLVRGNPECTVFVGRLNPRTTQETIEKEFSKCGRVVYCRLVREAVTGRSRRYAFVEFSRPENAERALRLMHREFVDGAELLVEREAERRLSGWRPRRLGGGFGGHRTSGQLRFGGVDRPFQKPILLETTRPFFPDSRAVHHS